MTKTSVFCLHHLTVVLKVPISLQSSAFWYQDHTLTCFFVTIRHCYQLTTVKDVDDKKPWNLFTAFDCRFKGAHFSAIFSFLILLLLLGCVAFCLSYITFRSRTLVVLMHWKAVSCNWYNQNNKVVLLSILQVNAVEPSPEQSTYTSPTVTLINVPQFFRPIASELSKCKLFLGLPLGLTPFTFLPFCQHCSDWSS